MALAINVKNMKRGDMPSVDPSEIVVDYSLNPRPSLGGVHEETAVASLAAKIAVEGQLQPVLVRRIADNRLQLVFGFRRFQAVSLLNKDRSEPLLLKCLVTDSNEAEGFLKAISENKDRKATNAIDDAMNQRRLSEQYGKTDAEIATHYSCTVAWVSQLRNLLKLSDKQRADIVSGKISTGAALALVGLSEEDASEAVSAATDASGKVSTSKLKKHIRDKGKKVGRSLKEVREFFESLTENTHAEPVREFTAVLLNFIKGTRNEKSALAAVEKLYSANPKDYKQAA